MRPSAAGVATARGPAGEAGRDEPDGPLPVQSLARRLAAAPRGPWPSRPVPVALVITDLDVGGAERALADLATRLDRGRWRPSVVCLDGEGALAPAVRAAGVEVLCLGVDRRRPLDAINRLSRAFRAIRPALVQSFLFHANVASRLAVPWRGRPWVVGGLRVAERRDNGHLVIDRLTCRLSAGSVCVSRGVERFGRESGLPADRLTVIPNGVDPAPFDRAEPAPRAALGVGDGDGDHLALYVGRLDPQKGLDDLLAAAAAIARPGWSLWLAGDGPSRAPLEARIGADPALQGRVRLLGRRDDVPSLLRSADVLVLPSLWEGMPNAILEAMAARRAVVATSVEGSVDLVVPGRTGWLVPPRDPAALSAALLEAASDPGRLARFGEAGRARVEAEFSPRAAVAAYHRLWAGLLGYEP